MPARSLTYAEIDKAFYAICRIKDNLPANLGRREQIQRLIIACIAHGFDTRHLIVKWLRVAGRSPSFVAKVLDEHTGSFPDDHLWQLVDDNRYILLHPATATKPPRNAPAAIDLSFMDALT